MGTLKPGATYIYERDGSKIYAREFGQTERQLVGYDYKDANSLEGMEERLRAREEWKEIFEAADSSPALQEAVERVRVIYRLMKNNE